MAVQFQGVPGGVPCGTIPGKASTSRSTPVGNRRWWCDLQSVVYTRVAWETVITKSNLASVYNRSLPDSVYTRSWLDFVYKRGGVILITPVSVGRRALGRPEHSHRAIAMVLAPMAS